MHDPFGHDKPLPGLKVNALAAFLHQVDDEVSGNHVEEFIIVFVLMPVILTLNDAESNNRVIDFAQGLVVPAIGAGFYHRGDVDQLKWIVQNVEVGDVGVRSAAHIVHIMAMPIRGGKIEMDLERFITKTSAY
jgi:hypothetical protein